MRSLTLIFVVLASLKQGVAQEQAVPPSRGPDYRLQHQYGANKGFYSLGIGYENHGFEPSVSIGWTPPNISQLNFELNWQVWRAAKKEVFECLLGFSLLLNGSPNTYFELPKQYPNKYYPPNAYFFGVQAVLRHHNFYVEISMLDYYFEVLARNAPGTMRSGDLLSVGVGYVQEIDLSWSEFLEILKL
ncbi:hypothetical protein [Pseudobacteriovorax antillogorgiicola]|uniref:Uncharacterized protein n=1 Tax=Pseudobacteriovorax antillogorgiicola TaxID=1513793 RepID=A0A1Y6BNW4_9BACT|nr:hypothetical protein [Pseudobacteriovorax antillogorgiicola]TCS55427.1 hypothetical protein EDD56_105148 [Pseudobacteriovorax antillogorgiicola]SMF12546.1 hypothetical protein SAMN06296036_105176 [Pseudobacteriovorax antillogorgiicola]